MKPLIRTDPWQQLRRLTRARIALGRAGDSLPTRELLAFGLDHARARDAVHLPLDVQALSDRLSATGLSVVRARSAAVDRQHYLRRPDLGRRLDDASHERLAGLTVDDPPDVALVIADGLSAQAAQTHAPPLVEALRRLLGDWRFAPLVIAEQARVALGDEIGELLHARQVVMLIGERPGLSSPDSLGLYLTHSPRPGLSDAQRNCISNVRPEGLAPADAARKLARLLRAAAALGRSGVDLAEDDGSLSGPEPQDRSRRIGSD